MDVEEIPQDQGKLKQTSSTTCLNCNVTWSSPRSLVAHMRQTKCGTIVKKGRIERDGKNKDGFIRKMWASKSVQGYYNCKLCYQRFRSKGGAQAHMSSKHRGMSNVKTTVVANEDSDASGSDSDSNSQTDVNWSPTERKRQVAPVTKFIKTPFVNNSNGNSSDSDSIPQARNADKHSSMERERRKALASKFETLSDALSLDKGSSKVKILDVARVQITLLEAESTKQQRLLEELKTINAQLQSRYSELKIS